MFVVIHEISGPTRKILTSVKLNDWEIQTRSVVIEHNYSNTTLCNCQGDCSSIKCNNFHVKLPAGVRQNGWRDGRRLVEVFFLDNLTFCSFCKLGPVPLTAYNVVGELQKKLCGYLYVVCQNDDCQFVTRVAYGKTHRQKK